MTQRPIHRSVRSWTLPRAAIAASFDEMAADGELEREGICLWGGRRRLPDSTGNVGVDVTHVILLRGDGVVRHQGFIGISPILFNDVTDALAGIGDGVYIVGQIHSHPPYCSVDLSPTDVKYGIATPQFLSIVAPRFGMDPRPTVASCGVHVFETPRWRRLSDVETSERCVLSDGVVETVLVGQQGAVP